MIVAGCDVGSLTAKAVILKDGRILATRVMNAKSTPENSARIVMEQALADANLSMGAIQCCFGTGYGRNQISFVNDARSEISCHALGAHFLMPKVRTVIDIGGQDCKVARLDKDGKVVQFVTNDKCAAGTGRFLEIMAEVLGLTLDEFSRISTKATSTVQIASLCTVWAQAEVIRHVNADVPTSDIVASINHAMAARVAIMTKAIGVEKDVCMTGGVSKNNGVLKSLQESIGVKINKPRVDPQLVGALGAALYAARHSGSQS